MDIATTELRAGPLRCRFADGELRYLKIGNVELVRRIFFAVRTKTWDTLQPTFPNFSCDIGEDRFVIRFDAVCERGAAGYDSDGGYKWSAEIFGDPDGTIRFRASGMPTRDFDGNRVGLCVLFGTPDVCGTEYELVSEAGVTKEGVFPKQVNAPLTFEERFLRIRSRRGPGQGILVNLDGDGVFSMEDQRNFSDSSFKAYATMPYAYPKLKGGQRFTQEITLSPEGYGKYTYVDDEASYVMGPEGPAGVVPRLSPVTRAERRGFHPVNHEREKTRAKDAVSFAYYPVEHLIDDDTCWENAPCIRELADSARAIAPGKPVDIVHVAIKTSHPSPKADPRNSGSFGAAWAAAVVGYSALAGVRSMQFDFGPGLATKMVERLKALEGKPVRAVRISHAGLVSPLVAFDFGGKLVLINRTREMQKVGISGKGTWLEPWEVRFV